MSRVPIRVKRRYAVLKGRRERDIVRPPTPVQITPELPTATVFYSQEIWSGPAECRQLPPANTLQKKCGDDLNTAVGISLPRWCGYRHSPSGYEQRQSFSASGERQCRGSFHKVNSYNNSI